MTGDSDFRVHKRRTEAALTLATGATIRGCFFLAGARATQDGPERVADLLNAEPGFFPFEMNGDNPPCTALFNRAQLILVTLLENAIEAQLDPGYSVATERRVRVLLSNGDAVCGRARVYRPAGRDRLSDYARLSQPFRYIETDAATLIVNSSHIVELREIETA